VPPAATQTCRGERRADRYGSLHLLVRPVDRAAQGRLERAAPAHQLHEARGATGPGVQAENDFRLADQRLLARSETHVERQQQFAAGAAHAAAQFADRDLVDGQQPRPSLSVQHSEPTRDGALVGSDLRADRELTSGRHGDARPSDGYGGCQASKYRLPRRSSLWRLPLLPKSFRSRNIAVILWPQIPTRFQSLY
jgi:hypothetical protein